MRMKPGPDILIQQNGPEDSRYADLLGNAARQGLGRLTTRILQFPCERNGYTAVVTARAVAFPPEGQACHFADIMAVSCQPQATEQHAQAINDAVTRVKCRVLQDMTHLLPSPVELALPVVAGATTARKATESVPLGWEPGRDGRPITDYDREWLTQMAERRGPAGMAWLQAIGRARTDADFQDICTHLETLPVLAEE
jgi:hypothetical protein